MAGSATSGSDDLHGRAGAHAARPLHRRDGRTGTARRGLRGARDARRIRAGTRLVAWLGDSVMGGREADPRPGNDRDRVPRVWTRAHGRAEVVRARSGWRLRRGARPRVLADPRGGAARLPGLDDGALADRTLPRAPDVGPRSGRVRDLGCRGTHANATRGPVRRTGSRASLDRLAVRACTEVAHRVEHMGLGRRGHPGDRHRLRTRGGDGACLDRVAKHDARLQGSDLRARELGARRAHDRHRCSPRAHRRRGARASDARRRAISVHARSSRRASPR